MTDLVPLPRPASPWPRFASRAFVVASLALPGLLIPGGARASLLSWKTAVSGNAGSAGNWNPTKVPTSSDDLFYTLAGTYTVTFDATVPASHGQTVNAGTVSLAVTSPHTVGTNLIVAPLAGQVGLAAFLSGTTNVVGSVEVANGSGATGTVNVNGVGSVLKTTGAGSSVNVGFGGTGTMNLLNGGALDASGFGITLGEIAGANGTLNALGFQPGSSGPSDVLTTGAGADLIVGDSGAGTLSATGGSVIETSGAVRIARGSGSTGTATFSGTASGGSATDLVAPGGIDVARNDVAGTAAGTGTLQLLTPARAAVGGGMRVGDPDGGTGTLRVRTGVFLQTRGLVCDDAHGVFDFNGGTIDLIGNSFHPPGTTLELDSASPEVLELEGGTTAAFSNSPVNAYSLIVADAHAATLTLSSSSHVNVSATMAEGLAPGSDGTVNVGKSASISTSSSGQLVVGLGGSGALNLTSAGTVDLNAVDVAAFAGSHGTVHVNGAGSVLTADSMFVGGLSGAAGGVGKLLVDANGLVRTTGRAPSLVDFPGDSVVVNSDASILVAGAFKLDGALALLGGFVDADSIALSATARVSGTGTVNAPWFALHSNVTTASGGPLTLGSATSARGFFDLGVLDVGAQTVTLLDASTASVDSVSLASGTLALPAAGGAIVPLGRLSGIGHVNGKLTNSGTIQAGAAPGLVFSGVVTGIGQGIAGGTLNFASGGGFSGFGTLDVTQLVVAPGATISTNGSTTLGSTAAGSTVSLGGVLHIGPGTTTVNHVAAGLLPLGTSTTLSGSGTLKRTNGFTLLAGDSLLGSGTVAAPFSSGGIVSPGVGPGPGEVGQLTFTTTFLQGIGGTLVMEIGTNAASGFDHVIVTGAATLAGTLDVRLRPGTVPQAGQDFTLMTYASHAGTFGAVTIFGQPVGSQFTLTYNATSLLLHVNAITVDAPTDPAAGIAAVTLAGRSGARGETYFDLALPRAAHVDLAAFGATGRRVAALFRGDLPAGRSRYALRAGGRELAPGLYFGRAIVTEGGTWAGDAHVTVRTARAVVER